MKKFISAFLLVAFLFNTAGVFGLLMILKQENYESVFARNSESLDLIHLIIPKSEKIYWEKKDEIVYEGRYYDVFDKSEDDKNIYLLCYSDSKDNSLAETLHKHLSQHDKYPKKKAGSRIVFSLQNCLLQGCSWSVQLSAEKISLQIINYTLSGFTSVFSPPPDFLA